LMVFLLVLRRVERKGSEDEDEGGSFVMGVEVDGGGPWVREGSFTV
jgi:hypothetical protein